jgi:hypothetical protein
LERLVGRELEVLWERTQSDGHGDGMPRLSGYTPSYHRASMATGDASPRLPRIDRVRIAGLTRDAAALAAQPI